MAGEKYAIESLGLEKKKERISLTLVVYLIRHGETTSNKSDVSRELTEKGKRQVEKAIEKIITQVQEFVPVGSNKQQNEEILKTVKFRIYDSETPRTMEQAQIEKEALIQHGVPDQNIYILHPAYNSADIEQRNRKAGPGVKSRIGTVTDSTPDFRKKLDDPEYQKSLGAADGVIAWMLTPDEEIPKGIETYSQARRYMEETKAGLQKLAKRINDRGDESMVVIANSHAPRVTVAMSSELNMDPKGIQMAGNAEGLRLKFNEEGEIDTELFNIPKKNFNNNLR